MKRFFNKLSSVIAISAVFAAHAHAAGGLSSGTTAVTTFNTWLFAFIGIVSISYLTFKCVQLAGEKIQWIDLGYAIAKVAVIGGVPVLGAWAYAVYA
ncbi:hypothetical protein [Massilia putida]|uniref:hypothetical protein n=1 Tax=Massilia putida TaxID=1141883 RepID=UPI00095305FA|nr:hypothetical protein [Massilia putida]